ncbi:MAG: leucine-rich repeat domain-containing protein [Clostridiales bacterium]|nr:leucine-rich repeat domain-containing protein [Clostridiales bacterium]
MLIIIATLSCALVACTNNKPPEHVHTFPSEFKWDDNQHWHECECGEKDTIVGHSYNRQGVCIICDYHKNPDDDVNIREGNVVYREREDGTYEVSRLLDRTVTSQVIPATVKDKPVTAIGQSAFVNDIENQVFNEYLESVTLPEGLLEIDQLAFMGCQKLKSVTIPSTVTKIGRAVFKNCPILTEIIIPDTVIDLNTDELARGCQNLDRVVFNSSLTDIEYMCLAECPKLREVVLGPNVTRIGETAFYQCTNLQSINFPDSLTTIEKGAFTECRKLAALNFGKNSKLTTIGDNAFQDCESLTSIELPDAVESIGGASFGRCTSLTSFKFGANIEIIGAAAFLYCENIESLTLPDGVKAIAFGAFEGLKKITSFVVPDSVTDIGAHIFSECDSLETLTLPFVGSNIEHRRNIGYFFDNNISDSSSDLVSNATESNRETLPSTLKTITITKATGLGDNAFTGCQHIETINIPDSISFVGMSAFNECPNLKLTKDDKAYYIGSANNPHLILTRAEDTSITSCAINEKTKVIAGGAFNSCSGLRSITIPDSVISVGRGAFDNCANLRTNSDPNENNLVYLGSSTNPYKVLLRAGALGTSTTYKINNDTDIIAGSAFGGASALTEITIPSKVRTIGASAFSRCISLTGLELPSVKYIENKAFDGCEKLTEITIDKDLIAIDGEALNDCNLKKVSIPGIAAQALSTSQGTLKELKITSGEKIPEGGFSAFSMLTKVELDDGIKTIGDGAFYRCINLQSINIPTHLEYIGDNAFYNTVSLAIDIVIPDSVTYIGELAFEKSGIKKVTIGKNVKTIGYRAFTYMSDLEELTVVDGNENYFSANGCLIEKVTKTLLAATDGARIPTDGSVTIISDSAFAEKNITSVDISVDITRIEDGAFAETKFLTEINYGGTKKQFLSIYRGTQSFSGSGATITINCSDGKLKFVTQNNEFTVIE